MRLTLPVGGPIARRAHGRARPAQANRLAGGRQNQSDRKVCSSKPSGGKGGQTDLRGQHSLRFVRKNGESLQRAFDDTNKLSHLDCKSCDSNA